MANPKEQNILLGGPIYTLAQNPTKDILQYPFLPKVITGNGSDRSDQKAMLGRAKKKLITQSLMLSLIDIAKEKGHFDRLQPYWNTYHCQSHIITNENRVHGNYCKNKWCSLCCSIRKAKIINTYYPIIKTWLDPYFVTLTVRSVKAHQLKKWMQHGLLRCLDMILDKYRAREKRGKGERLVGIRSLECNFNPQKRTYNPHLHLVVANKEMAEILINEWLERWTTKHAESWCQDKRRVGSLEGVLIEIIKYGSKIFTDPDMGKGQSKIPTKIYAHALDNIYEAMEGRRLFGKFGFTLPKVKQYQKSKPKIVQQYNEWTFDGHSGDWLNVRTGQTLTGHIPSSQVRYVLNQIDTDLY